MFLVVVGSEFLQKRLKFCLIQVAVDVCVEHLQAHVKAMSFYFVEEYRRLASIKPS